MSFRPTCLRQSVKVKGISEADQRAGEVPRGHSSDGVWCLPVHESLSVTGSVLGLVEHSVYDLNLQLEILVNHKHLYC